MNSSSVQEKKRGGPKDRALEGIQREQPRKIMNSWRIRDGNLKMGWGRVVCVVMSTRVEEREQNIINT